MKKSVRALALMLALSLVLTSCGAQRAAAVTMRLRKLLGTVRVSDSLGLELEPREDLSLYNGYGLRTAGDSYAWIDLDSVKLTKMDQQTVVDIQKSGKSLEVFVHAGRLFFNVTKPLGEDENMDIRTSSTVVGIRGTCGWVEAPEEGDDLHLYLLEGQVTCTTETQSRTVRAGEMAAMTKEGDITIAAFEVPAVPEFVREEVDIPLAEAILEASGLDLLGLGGEPQPSEPQPSEPRPSEPQPSQPQPSAPLPSQPPEPAPAESMEQLSISPEGALPLYDGRRLTAPGSGAGYAAISGVPLDRSTLELAFDYNSARSVSVTFGGEPPTPGGAVTSGESTRFEGWLTQSVPAGGEEHTNSVGDMGVINSTGTARPVGQCPIIYFGEYIIPGLTARIDDRIVDSFDDLTAVLGEPTAVCCLEYSSEPDGSGKALAVYLWRFGDACVAAQTSTEWSGSAQPEITLSMISCCRLADAAGCAALRENTAFYQYWDKNIEALTALELM